MATYPRRIVTIAAWAALPAVLIALGLLWSGPYGARVQWTGTLIVAVVLAVGLSVLYDHVIRPLQTASNLLAAMREGDFSLRARSNDPDDDLGLLYVEANGLADMLRMQRLDALEAGTLLRAVMAGIDAAVLAFDGDGRLLLINRGGEQLLNQAPERAVGRHAGELGLAECLEGETPRVLERPGQSRWELRRTTFRQDGRPHQLVLLTDVSRTLQAEEREAWQRLIRVLSHEINNSLTPIRSFAGSLRAMLQQGPRTPEEDEDLRRGLDIIGQRADSLGRFIAAYARLARLPVPVPQPVLVEDWVQRVVALETRRNVVVTPGPSVVLLADVGQLEQLLINLVRNAADAVGADGSVAVTWSVHDRVLELSVLDDGPGIADSANLFVPFYTTKPGGSGIGLALSRRIAEAHGGRISLENRPQGGCIAKLRLPLGREAVGFPS